MSEGNATLSFQNVLSAHIPGREVQMISSMRTSCLRRGEEYTNTYKRVQPSQILRTKGLPAANNCETTREILMCLIDRKKVFGRKYLWASSYLTLPEEDLPLAMLHAVHNNFKCMCVILSAVAVVECNKYIY